MKKITKGLLLGITFFISCISLGQAPGSGNSGLTQVIPPSPDAASLGKYGEIPVGKYTGTASTAVPVYTIDFDGLKIPVTLNYHAGGIKVEELASWVGLGWSLSAGGIITKTVVGLPDDMAGGGFLNNSYQNVEIVPGLPLEEQRQIAGDMQNGILDMEPDNYYFNFLGYSGKIMIDKATRKIYTMPKTNLKFSVYPLWEITDAAGFKYIFNDGETSIIDNNKPGTRHNYTSGTTMVLTKIISPAGNEISFSYQDYKNLYFVRGGQSVKYNIIGMGGDHACVPDYDVIKTDYSVNEVMGKRIREITWNGGKVVFNKTANNREDITGDYSLDNIEVYNSQNQFIQKHKLYYSFRGSSNGMSGFPANFTSLVGSRRLFLDSVKQISGNENIPPYSFQYNGANAIPYYLSFAQDHWGYCNGQNTNPNLLPVVGSYVYPNRIFGLANRNVNTDAAKNGILEKITYPTGGQTQFFYESNEAQIDVCDYVYTINPNNIYNFEPVITASINQNRREAQINVPPTLCHENKKKFTYVVNLGTPVNCQGGTRDCTGTLQVNLYNNTAPSQTINLLNNPIVNGQTRGELLLVPGATYTLVLDGTGPAVNGVSAAVTGYANPVLIAGTNKVNTKVGGLRIAKVISSAQGSPSMATNYYYFDKSDVLNPSLTGQNSSGRVAGIPRYMYEEDYNVRIMYNDPLNGPTAEQQYCHYLNLAANSLSPMSGENGVAVGYKMVEEIKDGGQDKIKRVSTFTTTDDYPDFMPNTYPYTSTNSSDFLRGLQLKEYALNFNSSNQTYSLLKETENKYTISEEEIKKVNGLKWGCTKYYSDIDSRVRCTDNLFRVYQRRSQWFYLSSTNEKEYDKSDPSKFLQSQVKFTYNNLAHLQMTQMETANSKGEIIKTEFKYPHDFQSAAPYNLMVQKNIISAPVETKTTNVTNNKQLALQKISFTQWQSGNIHPSFIEKSTLGMPLEKEATFVNYDNKGNLLEFVTKDGITNSVIWGYNQQYPVAKIAGKSYNDAIVQSGINQAIVNNPPNEAALRTELNRLRLLQGATVNTYTYQPLIGMTSETDPRGMTIYYEYDIFNRLSLVRDNNKNILKKICYNYAGQPENCNTSSTCTDTAPQWQNTKNVRCQVDKSDNNTGYLEEEQTDMNPCSPTYNQTQWIQGEYNGNACPAAVTITATNVTDLEGYTAAYKNQNTGQMYTFNIPPSVKMQEIGSLPVGLYSLKIYKSANESIMLTFESGCGNIDQVSGTVGDFPNINITQDDCNSIKLNW